MSGQALIIVGPQGCGKTTRAREIAAQHGAFAETDFDTLRSPFGFGRILDKAPQALIVDGFPRNFPDFHAVAALLESETTVCHRKGREEKLVRTPMLIFCIQDRDLRGFSPLDPRRFRVISMNPTAPPIPQEVRERFEQRKAALPHRVVWLYHKTTAAGDDWRVIANTPQTADRKIQKALDDGCHVYRELAK